MAVEATHPNQTLPFSVQSVQDFGNNAHQMQQFSMIPPVKQFYQPFVPAKTCINTVESGLTCNLPGVTRKRSLDVMNYQKINNCVESSPLSPIFGDQLLPQMQQHQFEIDTILYQHTKKMRLELQERQNQQAKLLATAISEKAIRKLREKDQQIQRIGKINLALQERVKSLFMENQLWRDLAQTNEAQAQCLRSDLEQVLAHVAEVVDDAQSCCGSSGDDVEERGSNRKCKMCGERESCVLLLPCRHLCLCGVCGSNHVQACPVCNSTMNATLHLNLSS